MPKNRRGILSRLLLSPDAAAVVFGRRRSYLA
jgi:hypothetical protein